MAIGRTFKEGDAEGAARLETGRTGYGNVPGKPH